MHTLPIKRGISSNLFLISAASISTSGFGPSSILRRNFRMNLSSYTTEVLLWSAPATVDLRETLSGVRSSADLIPMISLCEPEARFPESNKFQEPRPKRLIVNRVE